MRSVDLATGELINYEHPSDMAGGSSYSDHSLVVDRQGNVWAGSLAKLSLNPNRSYTWEKVPYPPEFVYERELDPHHDNPKYANQYKYYLADIHGVDMFSDGSLWFNTTSGIVQYDPVKRTWCKRANLLTTPAVTDDGQGNLWLAVINNYADRRLSIYKHVLNP